jgi:uncharacterized protein YbaR (Trm112 family)
MVTPELLQILRCPETMQKVRIATTEEIQPFTAQTRTRSGTQIESPLEQGLIREDGTVLYPIRNGIPVMLMEEAIGLV